MLYIASNLIKHYSQLRTLALQRQMDVEDFHSIKAQEAEIKRQTQQPPSPFGKIENGRDQGGEARTVELLSDNSTDKGSVYKQQRKDVSERAVETVDLSKQILTGIVKHCRRERLISEELAHCFFIHFTTKVQAQYIQYYKARQLNKFDFAKSKINIIDHRRLTEMLARHNNTKYLPPTSDAPYDYLKDGRDFLREIYAMSHQEYHKLIQEQVNKYYQTWWGGPENPHPNFVEPVVEVVDVEQAARQREQMEKLQMAKRIQEQQQRRLRISEKKATGVDLMEIASRISTQLFNKYQKPQLTQIKYQQGHQNEENGQDRRKKDKEDTRDNKQKKSKHKSKKKKSKTESQVKKQWIQENKAKRQSEMELENLE